MFRIILSLLIIISLILPILSYKSFIQIIKLVKIRRGNLLVSATLFLLTGYIFFLSPWIFIGEDIIEVRTISYYVILIGMLILSYGAIKIYTDWREVVK